MRHAFLILFAVLVVAGYTGEGNFKQSERARVVEATRPNIVVVMVDDLNNEEYAALPRIHRMMDDQGTVFKNSFVTNPLCCPSRATFLRGQYSHNTKVESNVYPSGGHKKFEEEGLPAATIATRMYHGGYKTGFFGKYMNGFWRTDPPTGWSRWVLADNFHDKYADRGKFRDYPENFSWTDDLVGQKASWWIRSQADSSQPFYTWVSFSSPHSDIGEVEGRIQGTGYTPPDRHLNTRNEGLPDSPGRDEQDLTDKPEWVRKNGEFSTKYPLSLKDDYNRQLEMMDGVTDNLQRIINALRDAGKLDNTYIVFTSDNGYMFGEHGIVPSKKQPYEESVGVPLVVRGPGVKAGAVRNEMVLNNDLYPTTLDLAGISRPPFVDGRSLKPLAVGEYPDWRKRFLAEDRHTDESQFGNPTPPTYHMVRTKRYKYVEYDTGETELYDLREDPHELRNLAGEEPDLQKDLAAKLKDLKGCASQECRKAEGFASP